MTHDTAVRVDHVGIAVDSIADAEGLLVALGARKVHEEAGPDGSFTWATYRLGGASRIELLAPREGESFLTAFLDREGPGLHHVTLEVADIDAVVDALEAAGYEVVDYVAREDWTEAFVSPANPTGALFQLMEYHAGYAEGRDGAYVDGRRLGGDPDESGGGPDGRRE